MRRVVIKVSGEFLRGDSKDLYNVNLVREFCDNIARFKKENQIALVVGAGNLMRGRDYIRWGMKRVEADEMGMLFTVANALFLRNILNLMGVETIVMSPIQIVGITEQYNRSNAIRLLEEGKIVIFGGGIGNPFVSTDYLAVQRSIELEADQLFMSKNVDAVYESNPSRSIYVKKYKNVSYSECIRKNIAVCDQSAFILAQEYNLKMQIYSANDICKIVKGENIGTSISNEEDNVFY